MSDLKKIKELIARKKKPEFYRNQWWKFWKFENKLKWKKPKGIDNPMRLKLKGYPPVVSVGYRTPKIIRGLHPSGRRPVVIHNIAELEGLNPEEVIVYVSGKVGLRKREAIVRAALERGFVIANARR